MEVCDQSTTIPLGCSFLLIHFPSSKMSPFYGIQFLQEKNLATEWAVHGMMLPQDTSSCSDMGSSLDHRGLQANLCFSAWRTSSYPSSLTLVLTRLFLMFSPSFSSACAFLKYTFPEVSPPWLQGLAMPCSGCVGICWNWHRVTSVALRRGCLAVPTASAWAQTPPTII